MTTVTAETASELNVPGSASGSADDHEHSRIRPAPVTTPEVDTLVAAGELLRALAAPVRIAIVLQLLESERCVHEIVDALGVAQPLISQHLRVLNPRAWCTASGTAARWSTASSTSTCRTSSWTP